MSGGAATPGEGVVTAGVLYDGFSHARERFEAKVASQAGTAEIYVPLFETLNWASALDDRLREDQTKDWHAAVEGGSVVLGVRFARNRVHHQWAAALELTEGFSFPVTFPKAFHEWRWRGDLPAGHPFEAGEKIYKRELVGKPARLALRDLSKVFAEALSEAGPTDIPADG